MLEALSEYDITLFYGSCALLVCALAWGSGRPGLQKLALTLLASVAVSNMTYGVLHPPVLVAVNALQDACLFTAAAVIMRGHASARRLIWPIGLSYVAMECVHTGALLWHNPRYVLYYYALNGLYLVQLSFVGGTAGVELVRRITRYFGRGPGARPQVHGAGH